MSAVKREPVVTAFVVSAVALLAAVGVEVENSVAEAVIDWASVALTVFSMVKARSKVTPV